MSEMPSSIGEIKKALGEVANGDVDVSNALIAIFEYEMEMGKSMPEAYLTTLKHYLEIRLLQIGGKNEPTEPVGTEKRD